MRKTQYSTNCEPSYLDVLYLYINVHNSLAPVRCGTQAMLFKLIIDICSFDTHSEKCSQVIANKPH